MGRCQSGNFLGVVPAPERDEMGKVFFLKDILSIVHGVVLFCVFIAKLLSSLDQIFYLMIHPKVRLMKCIRMEVVFI